MGSFARALRSLSPFPKPRTEMVCDVCGGFSSTRRCFVCSSSPAGLALSLAEANLLRLEGLEEENQKLREQLDEAQVKLDAIAVEHGPFRDQCKGNEHFYPCTTCRLITGEIEARGYLRRREKESLDAMTRAREENRPDRR